MDYDLVAAAGTADAIAILDATPIDLVIADHAPPGARADEVIAALRAKRPALAARVLVGGQTAPLPAVDRCRALRRPVSVGELAGTLDELLERS